MTPNKNNLSQELFYEHLKTINELKFTPREIDIIACLLSGKATKAVANFLSIEEKTVETHKYNIMRKLECNSKESIIDFVEKSDKFPFIRKHYLELLTQKIFERLLEDILELRDQNPPRCSVVYWRKEESKTPFIDQLEKHLDLGGIKSSLKTRESYKSPDHLAHSIESQPVDYVLYILPAILVDQFHTDGAKGKKETLPFIQKSSQNPGSVIFILKDRDTTNDLPQDIQNTGCVDFTEQRNYYFSFLEVLKKILPNIVTKEMILEFKSRYELIGSSSEKPLPQLWLEETGDDLQKENDKKNVSYNIFLSFFKKRKKSFFILIGIILLCIFCTLFIVKRNTSSLTIQAKTTNVSYPRSDLPLPHDNVLLERSDLISQIETYFKKGCLDIQSVALVGIGGSGKTIIARQYARRQEGLVWEINAETRVTLRESFENFAYLLAMTEGEKKTLMGLKDIRNPREREEKILLFIKERLKFLQHWILIFDNVENFSDIAQYYPSDSAVWGVGKVIITTQNSHIETHSSVHQTILVGELTPNEKIELFQRILNTGGTHEFTTLQKEKLNAIPSFPLDVSIAAHYLKATNTPYNEYVKNINEHKSDFDSVQSTILNETGRYSKTRYKIITLSLEKIIKESKEFREILLFISLMDPHNIPKELLNEFKDSVLIDNFLHHLKKYSLATHNNIFFSKSSIPCLTIHRSTQDIALTYLAKELKLDKDNPLLNDISYVFGSYIDKALEEEDFPTIRLLESHADMFLKHNNLLSPFIAGLIGSRLGCIYYFLNNQAKAQTTIEASLTILKNHLLQFPGKDDVKIAQAFLHIGNVYNELGYYDRAQELFEKSLDIYNKNTSQNKLEIAWTISHLGNVYRNLGYYEKARNLLKESNEIQEKYNPENYKRIARTLCYLGNVYRGLGDYKRAIEVLDKSLKYYKKCFPDTHFRIGWVLSHLGNIYRKLGNFDKSKNLFSDSLEIYQKNFSEDHVIVGLIFSYLGNSYRDLKDYEKAKYFLEKSLNVHKKQCNENYQKIGWISFHLSEVYMEIGDYKKAKELFKDIIKIYERDTKKGDIEKAQILRNIGLIYLVEGQLIEAEKFLTQSLKILEQKQHPKIYLTLEYLAELYNKKSTQAIIEGHEKDGKDFKDKSIDQLNQALRIVKTYLPNHTVHLQRIQSKLLKLQKGEQ
jgi:tetratricopeptide (TPR) repeat protein